MILVLGQSGQIAKALSSNPNVHCLSRAECDLAYPDQLELSLLPLLESKKVKFLINAAAYTQVDEAEKEHEKCLAINGTSPSIIAKMCEKTRIPMIHFSSDYVYGSNSIDILSESADTTPLNYYGKTKLLGDQGIQTTHARAMIIRTSWVYDHQGKNFFNTMLKLFKTKTELNVVNDQIGSPSYAPDLAKIAFQLIKEVEKLSRPEVVHVTNSGLVTWFDFANMILEKAKVNSIPLTIQKVNPILSSQYPTPAKRQLNSRLSLDKLTRKFGITPRTIDQALNDCFKQYLELA